MRWLPILLFACGSPEPIADTTPAPAGDEAPAESRQEAEEEATDPAVAATEALFAFLAEPGDSSPLAAHVETLADAVAREGSHLTAGLRAHAENLRSGDMSDQDTRETVQVVTELLWLLVNEREPDPRLCAIGRVLGRQGVAAWREALTRRIEGEGVTLGEAATAPDCSGLDENSTEAEECQYAVDLAEAHRVAFAEDGPLASIERGLEEGPEATAAAIEAHLDDLRPLRRLISARPRAHDMQDLGEMCRPTP